MLDTCAVNSGLVWEKIHPELKQAKRGQRRFRETLIQQLLSIPYKQPIKPQPPPQPIPLPIQGPFRHQWEKMEQRRHCVWCRQQARTERPALVEITNTAPQGGKQRGSKSYGGCKLCGVYLCVKTACFDSYHSQK
jgi:hypothetical protein